MRPTWRPSRFATVEVGMFTVEVGSEHTATSAAAAAAAASAAAALMTVARALVSMRLGNVKGLEESTVNGA